MNLLELISERRSVRAYLPANVEQEKLDYLMECARLAPSAANFQPWKFIIVKDAQTKASLQKCYPAPWFASAPVYIVALGDSTQSWKREFDAKDHYDIDVAIAIEHIVLAATEQGLGTCWVCHFNTELCRKLLNLPENEIPVAILTVGYPAHKNEKVTNRKSMTEIVKIF